MKAAVLHDKYDMIVEEVDEPRIERHDQVLVKIHSALSCGADLHLFVGNMESQYPIVPGYCFSGAVKEVGGGATDLRVGNRVCGLNFGSFGAFAENILVSQDRIYKIPDSVSSEEAAFIEPVALGSKSLELTRPIRRENALILGQGILGLLHAQLFKKAGTIAFATDPIPSRLNLSRRIGADYALNPNECDLLKEIPTITEQGIDIVIEATGNSKIVKLLSKFANEGVRMVLFSVWNPSIKQFKASEKEIEIYRFFGASREDCITARRMVSDDKVDLRSLISHRVRLEKIEEAYELALNPSQGKYTPKAIGTMINP